MLDLVWLALKSGVTHTYSWGVVHADSKHDARRPESIAVTIPTPTGDLLGILENSQHSFLTNLNPKQ